MKNNFANAITGLRASLTPFIFAYIVSSRSYLGLALYLVALYSDVVDGRVARKIGASSPEGAFYDVCADFLLVFSGVLGCVASGLLDLWVLGVIVLSFLQFIHGFGVRVVYDPFGRMFGVLSLLIVPLVLLLPSMSVLLVEYSVLFLGGCSFLARRLYLIYREDALEIDTFPKR